VFSKLFFKTGPFGPVLTFYDISGVGLHLSGTGKSGGVAQRRHGRWRGGNVTRARDLQSATGAIVSRSEIFFLF
jgi:hypothetical protein